MAESCLRCGAEMEWRHETWQCPRCRFKIGCCEGESPDECTPTLTASGKGHAVVHEYHH